MADEDRQSREAFSELLATLREVGERFAGTEWMMFSTDDEAETLRAILHHLATGLETQLDEDPARPLFRPIVTPWRKALGDNADAMYHDARIDSAGIYRVRGRTGGAIYVSFTVEAAADDGGFPSGTVGVLNDTGFDVDSEGRFDLTIGGPPKVRNWLGLAKNASRLTVRHYWEQQASPHAAPSPHLALTIDCVSGVAPAARAPDDTSIARSILRMATYVRSRTVDLIPRPGEADPPAFVSRVPNVFPAPAKPGAHALAAADAAYSMAPYVLGPDEALVLTGHWPSCRCANVSLWNRQLQTYDYLRHRVSLNRAQATADADGRFRIVLAHRDPGCANWLDTEGRSFGLVFWRFLLPQGPIETPQAEVVAIDSL
ncbi:MAG TPA: DUF1214 domain-containing protein [Candidatus Binatia bacterium]|jgi:hypothetical protein